MSVDNSTEVATFKWALKSRIKKIPLKNNEYLRLCLPFCDQQSVQSWQSMLHSKAKSLLLNLAKSRAVAESWMLHPDEEMSSSSSAL